jgi:hypothetical protein
MYGCPLSPPIAGLTIAMNYVKRKYVTPIDAGAPTECSRNVRSVRLIEDDRQVERWDVSYPAKAPSPEQPQFVRTLNPGRFASGAEIGQGSRLVYFLVSPYQTYSSLYDNVHAPRRALRLQSVPTELQWHRQEAGIKSCLSTRIQRCNITRTPSATGYHRIRPCRILYGL